MTATTAITRSFVVMVWIASLGALTSCATPKPNLVELAFLNGMQADEHGDLPEAASSYKRTTALDPSFCSGYFNLGDVYERQANTKEAIGAFETALSCFKGKSPQSPGVYSASTLKLDIERTTKRIDKLKGATSHSPQ